METKERTYEDRPSEWAPIVGDEPDKAQWLDEATGLPCLAVRHPKMGFWCGYVGVPPGHPLHGKHYDEAYEEGVSAHGGLTFADSCSAGGFEHGRVCHDPGPDGVEPWWFGFDCGHYNDLVPTVIFGFDGPGAGIYRDLDYVKDECRKLARSLAARADG